MIGKTRDEAMVAWEANQDVICPWCESHVEDDYYVVNGDDEVFHPVCLRDMNRENRLIGEFERDCTDQY